MIRLTYKNFRGEFLPAFEKLANMEGLHQKVAYHLGRVAAKLKPLTLKAQSDYIAVIKKHCLLDEKGEMVPENKVPGTFTIPPENKKAWLKAIEEFEKTAVTIDKLQLRVSDLATAKLTPNDYVALEPLISEMEVASEDKVPAPLPFTPKQGA